MASTFHLNTHVINLKTRLSTSICGAQGEHPGLKLVFEESFFLKKKIYPWNCIYPSQKRWAEKVSKRVGRINEITDI